MEKLILIDGNSLLNRAYYAMSVFTTKDGLPTNGIFGFVKLLLKIIDDEQCDYLCVAFDVHAPTFRHKRYEAYKGTRHPMPQELVVQVPILKELLQAMGVRTIEKEGFEADDLLGTLSRKFGAECHIYTGDRDCYQLVNEKVSVCFTKRGVSDLDILTNENFVQKTGLQPWQIVEEKSLMGDSSDNIPGVRGIGPKSALSLLQAYGSLDHIYEHLDELAAAMQNKLVIHEREARLSHELAQIKTDVPLSLTLEDCRIRLPFPEKARELFAKLEFRSLVNSDYFAKNKNMAVKTVYCNAVSDFPPLKKESTAFSLTFDDAECHIYYDGTEYVFRFSATLDASCLFPQDMKPLLDSLFAQNVAILCDLKAYLHKLHDFGIKIDKAEDVSLLRYLSDSNLRAPNEKEFSKDFALPDENCAYGLYLAYRDAYKRISGTEGETIYREIELPLAYVLYEMEKTGVRVDTRKFDEFSDKFNREITALSEKIFEIAGERFNLKSPFKLSEILFEKLGYDKQGAKKNIREGYSTGADVLERLAEKHEIARHVLRYRELQKLKSAYVDGIRTLVKGEVVHTTYNQTATTTGRLSSEKPNLQNIPVRTEEGRELRKLFIASEGNVLIDADYSQIELRLLAHCSGCKELIRAYNAEEDVHAATAAAIFGVPLGEVTGAMRRRAKTINFGVIYGMSNYGLSKDLGCSLQEAQEFIDKYFALHPEVKAFMEGNVAKAKESGFVTTILGRKRYIPEIRSSTYNVRMFGERAAMNMPLQGSAADIIKIAMLRVSERLKKEGLRAKLVLQVHDELLLDAPEEERERAERILREEMEQAVTLSVPLTVQIASGKSWYETK